MKHEGRGVIRIHDRTDHGGEVIGASSGTIVMGLTAALEGDMTICPRCKGTFAIKTGRAGAKHEGKHYAYHGDVTECGARLLSSLSPVADADIAQARSYMPTSAPSAVSASDPVRQYSDKFLIIEAGTLKPLARSSYVVMRDCDSASAGKTDSEGVAARVKI